MALNLYNDNLKPLNNDTALLEQYKIAINSAEKISDRRATANNFFIALNSVLFSLNNIDKLKSFDDFFSTILLCFSILICLVWIRLLKHYKEMNGVKFEIINSIEQKLHEFEKKEPTPNTKAMAIIEKIKKRNAADLFSNNTQEDPPNQ